MISDRKIFANRSNARASTGPRTAAGKARASRNAKRHGLALSTLTDPVYADEIKAGAKEIAGDSAPQQVQMMACRIVAAQIDLKLVRQARYLKIADALKAAKALSDHKSDRMTSVFGALSSEGGDAPMYGEIFAGLFARLQIFDRYERRALSRRKAAIRAFDAVR